VVALRQLAQLGHDVSLLPGKAVRPFVLRNKTDAADARAIWTAAQQPEMKNVAIKTEHQQSILALSRSNHTEIRDRPQENPTRNTLAEGGHMVA
jgi:transposase